MPIPLLQGSEAHQLSEAVATSERELGEAQAAVAAAQQKKAEMVAAAKVRAWRGLGMSALRSSYRSAGLP